MANKRDIERPKRLQIWGKSLAIASPSQPLPNQPKLRAKKLDVERPDSCVRRPVAETHAAPHESKTIKEGERTQLTLYTPGMMTETTVEN